MNTTSREILTDALVKHLEHGGEAEVTERAQVLDANTHEPYASIFTLTSPLGTYSITIEDRGA